MDEIEIPGAVAAGFEEVRDEFAAIVAEENGESGRNWPRSRRTDRWWICGRERRSPPPR
ncbi:hypothetical protein [Nocardia paucivorans]|uniref:hypothetical protein n=1 Tax=Nocardia paucivorans TaxID=114259 RepID=UPI0002DDD90D|nr:hypothetical protein [Nocardia paucivorans]